METLTLICNFCGKSFERPEFWVKLAHSYCDKKCHGARITKDGAVTVPCGLCGKSVTRGKNRLALSKSGHLFCNQQCAATYNNDKWGHGTSRRSKMEKSIESHLRQAYPDLEFLTNDRDVVEGELDFYFPSLKLGIEINGIFHYEPIYGQSKLDSIQKRDKLKSVACREKGIELAILCTYNGRRWSDKKALKYSKAVDDILAIAVREDRPQRDFDYRTINVAVEGEFIEV